MSGSSLDVGSDSGPGGRVEARNGEYYRRNSFSLHHLLVNRPLNECRSFLSPSAPDRINTGPDATLAQPSRIVTMSTAILHSGTLDRCAHALGCRFGTPINTGFYKAAFSSNQYSRGCYLTSHLGVLGSQRSGMVENPVRDGSWEAYHVPSRFARVLLAKFSQVLTLSA